MPTSAPESSNTRLRILVVDNDHLTREALREVLSEAGYDVCVAENHVEALEASRKRRVDLLLTDLEPSRYAGREVAEIARRQGPRFPVVLLTEDAPQDALDDALRLGARGFLSKPLDLDEMLHRVRGCLHATN